MRGRAHLALLLMPAVGLLPLGACTDANRAATAAQSAVQAQVNPTLSTTDTTFLNEAAQGGIAEVQMGQLAAERGGTAAVRRFGQQMVRDHTPVNQQLTQLAQAKQLSPPTTMDIAHQQLFDTLQGLRGRAFDRQYIQGQIDDHQAMVTLFQQEAQNGTDPEVKAFAASHLGVLQQHLRELEGMSRGGQRVRGHRT
jgi:putative membrane protein